MMIIETFADEIRDYFADRVESGLAIRHYNGRVPYLIVEIDEPSVDFLFRIWVFYEDGVLHMLKVVDQSRRISIGQWSLDDPSSIDNFFDTMDKEWYKHLELERELFCVCDCGRCGGTASDRHAG